MSTHGPTAKTYWGPRLWRVLHTLSCSPSIGLLRDRVQQVDERALWQQVLKMTAHIMPCALCAAHYKDWLFRSQIAKIINTNSSNIRTVVRDGLFNLHCMVNEANGVAPPNPIPYSAMEETYPGPGFRPAYNELGHTFEAGLGARLLKPEDIKVWRRTVERLAILYGL